MVSLTFNGLSSESHTRKPPDALIRRAFILITSYIKTYILIVDDIKCRPDRYLITLLQSIYPSLPAMKITTRQGDTPNPFKDRLSKSYKIQLKVAMIQNLKDDTQ